MSKVSVNNSKTVEEEKSVLNLKPKTLLLHSLKNEISCEVIRKFFVLERVLK